MLVEYVCISETHIEPAGLGLVLTT